jgi:hypothetical protein
VRGLPCCMTLHGSSLSNERDTLKLNIATKIDDSSRPRHLQQLSCFLTELGFTTRLVSPTSFSSVDSIEGPRAALAFSGIAVMGSASAGGSAASSASGKSTMVKLAQTILGSRHCGTIYAYGWSPGHCWLGLLRCWGSMPSPRYLYATVSSLFETEPSELLQPILLFCSPFFCLNGCFTTRIVSPASLSSVDSEKEFRQRLYSVA